MSFEFEVVGDFLGVGKLVWDVYVAYTDAPEQFRNFSQEILSLHVVFAQVKDQLQNTPTGSLSTKDTDNLTILYHGLKTTMEELDTLLKKYRADSVRLRDKLRSNLALLTTFNSSLAKYVYFSSPYIHSLLIPSIYWLKLKLRFGKYSAASLHSRGHNLLGYRHSWGRYSS